MLLAAAAPVVLACATPVAPDARSLAAGAVVMGLAIIPLARELGPANPTRRMAWIAGIVAALCAGFLLTPPGALVAASDLAGGSLVLVMGAGLLVASAFVSTRPTA